MARSAPKKTPDQLLAAKKANDLKRAAIREAQVAVKTAITVCAVQTGK
jgi:hypothetical protein